MTFFFINASLAVFPNNDISYSLHHVNVVTALRIAVLKLEMLLMVQLRSYTKIFF